MKITVLGCGSSMGVPAAGGFWGVCDPAEPKNERTRSSILVQHRDTTVLVDASYDLRMHLNQHKVRDIDAVLLSHSHADHISGLDDLRAIAFHHKKIIPLYSDLETITELHQRMPYQFVTDETGIYSQFVEGRVIPQSGHLTIGDIRVDVFKQDHGTCSSLGFRFGEIAYSVDMLDLDDTALEALKGVKVWIVDGGGYHAPDEKLTTHANFRRVREWVDYLKPDMTYVTVLTSKMDYKTLCDELPPHIRPCYDGMEIDMAGNVR